MNAFQGLFVPLGAKQFPGWTTSQDSTISSTSVLGALLHKVQK